MDCINVGNSNGGVTDRNENKVIYSGYKKYFHIPLFSNKAFFFIRFYISFLYYQIFDNIKSILPNNMKFNILDPN